MITVQDAATAINQLLPEPHAGLLAGILFGVRAQLSSELKNDLIRTGTIHITALSGMNITILVNLTVSTLLRIFSRRVSSLLAILIVCWFIWFVGPSASVVRAAIMGCLSLIAVMLGRQQRSIFFLFLTVILMLVVQPTYISDIGFQLSVLATLGILIFASPHQIAVKFPTEQSKPADDTLSLGQKRTIFRLIPSFVYDDIKTTLAAQVFTLPLLAFEFQRVSLISPLANVSIGFLIAPLTILGILMVIFELIFPVLAIPLSWVLYVLLSYLVFVIQLFSSFSLSNIQW